MRSIVFGTALAIMGAVGIAAAPGTPQFGAFGIDTAASDPSVRPGDDFYRMVNGRWLAAARIPPDMPYYGETLRLSAGEAVRLTGETVPVEAARGSERRLAFTLRVPVGVVCAIAPFNAPLSVTIAASEPGFEM